MQQLFFFTAPVYIFPAQKWAPPLNRTAFQLCLFSLRDKSWGIPSFNKNNGVSWRKGKGLLKHSLQFATQAVEDSKNDKLLL